MELVLLKDYLKISHSSKKQKNKPTHSAIKLFHLLEETEENENNNIYKAAPSPAQPDGKC